MNDRIRAYIEQAFQDIYPSRKVLELKEELLANLNDKYNDQISQGKIAEEAYVNAVNSIGDISELVASLNEDSPLRAPDPAHRHRHALMISISVGLYIASPFIIPLFAIAFHQPILGIMMFFVMIALATGVIIYANMTKPRYVKAEDTLVEDFKEWRSVNYKNRSAMRSFSSAYWSLVVAAYLGLSFLFGYWGFSWIIFIIAGAIEEIIKGIIRLGGGDK